MIEFAILTALWAAFLVFLSRRGTAHMAHPNTPGILGAVGALAAAMLELLPFTPVSLGFTYRTVIAIFGGFFLGRLVARACAAWALNRAKNAAGDARPPRLVHPMIAVGLFIAGLPATWHFLTANHALLEATKTPRDATTGIVKGAEPIRHDADATAGAVLLVHGLYSSPTDFGTLPEMLRARGLAVHAVLLPGHGTSPDDLFDVKASDWRDAVRKAYEELAAKHGRVVIVGFSCGGTLAALQAAEKEPVGLVLVNPFLGRLVTPPWSPIDADNLAEIGPRVISRTLAPESMRSGTGGFTYRTFALPAVSEALALAAELDGRPLAVSFPVMLLLSADDRVNPSEFASDWADSRLRTDLDIKTYEHAGHRIYLEADGNSAAEATVRFVAGAFEK